MTTLNIYSLQFSKNRHFRDQFFASENRFKIGMLKYKLPLIVIVDPQKVYRQFGVKNCYVLFRGPLDTQVTYVILLRRSELCSLHKQFFADNMVYIFVAAPSK